MSQSFEIAIVGGGICGLVCAIALAQQGFSAHVYEAAATFGEIGAGIGLGPNATEVLRAMGILDDVMAKVDESGKPNRSAWIQTRLGTEGSELVYNYPFGEGEIGVGMHRAALLDVLAQKLDPKFTTCHMSKRCIKVLQDQDDTGKIALYFADGTEACTDVVLGADGIKSAVRGAVTAVDSWNDVTFSKTICYRALIPTTAIQAAGVQVDLTQRPVCFIGEDKHILTFAIKGAQIINVVAFVSDRTEDFRAPTPDTRRPDPAQPTVIPATPQELLTEFEGWGSDVLGLLGCVQKTDKWLINVLYPELKSYVKGRVALLGDAAHAMLPHLGAGAGQGIEDAFLLSRLLSHPQTALNNAEDVLRAYDSVRRPRAQQVWEASRQAGDIYELAGRGRGLGVEGLREQLSGMADFVWHHQMEDDVNASCEQLRLLGVFTS